ncbi:MAG TPA: H-NS histone family protein [Rhodocyclaceae bacterium]|nr:H-NS histone family protein [Rhodocyclaceae bacterium]
MDISNLSIAQLKELQAAIPAEIAKRQAEDKQKVLDQMAALASSHGFSLDELLGNKGVGKKAGAAKAVKKVQAKYRHPSQADVTWTGRGRKPLWVAEWVASGKSLDDLAI